MAPSVCKIQLTLFQIQLSSVRVQLIRRKVQLISNLVQLFFAEYLQKKEEREKNVTLPPNRLECRCRKGLGEGKCLSKTSPTLP